MARFIAIQCFFGARSVRKMALLLFFVRKLLLGRWMLPWCIWFGICGPILGPNLEKFWDAAATQHMGTDAGWFGSARSGVYVAKHFNYVLKYSNALAPLEEWRSKDHRPPGYTRQGIPMP